jgi:NAD(P)-dependent dehydrogenase (short-subunit alcohol dehydrogenase family)
MNGMTGKVCIVTGSNSGIGKETALGLAQMGAHVVMVVRNMERGGKARAEIINKSGNSFIDLMNCDLSLMNSIRKFAEEFRGKYDRLDVLINNAGAAFNSREVTIEGLERTLAVDYFGPFLLTHELLPLLKSSAPSRIINLS